VEMVFSKNSVTILEYFGCVEAIFRRSQIEWSWYVLSH